MYEGAMCSTAAIRTDLGRLRRTEKRRILMDKIIVHAVQSTALYANLERGRHLLLFIVIASDIPLIFVIVPLIVQFIKSLPRTNQFDRVHIQIR